MKIVVFVPESHADRIRRTLADAGGGHIGKYDFCSFSMKGTGRFRGQASAKPFIGKSGRITKIKEERIETICSWSKVKKVLAALKKIHPYEEPAVDIYPLLNTKTL